MPALATELRTAPRTAQDVEFLRSLARRINPRDAGAHNNLGVVFYQKGLFKEAIDHFESSGSGSFSAMLLPVGFGVCVVENDSHAMTRRRSNICHEFGHLFLEHESGHLSFDDRCSSYDASVEAEAVWLGGELLIPRQGAIRCAREDLSNHDVAQVYGVSVQLAAMRMNASGARIQARRARSA